MRVVDRDVDAEVVAAEARVVEPAVQHVRAVQGLDRPSVIVVGVAEPVVLGERARDDRLRRSRRRAVARHDGSPAARQREACRCDMQPMQTRRGAGTSSRIRGSTGSEKTSSSVASDGVRGIGSVVRARTAARSSGGTVNENGRCPPADRPRLPLACSRRPRSPQPRRSREHRPRAAGAGASTLDLIRDRTPRRSARRSAGAPRGHR